jgi:hypothetical protein
MKLALTRQLFFSEKDTWTTVMREFPIGSIGEPVDIVQDEEGRIVRLKMIFYGLPGVHEILTSDLVKV